MTTAKTQPNAEENGVVDGTATEVPETAMVHTPTPPTLAVTPVVKAVELVERLDVIREAMNKAMTRDVDYGVIPGTDKPTLYKPGSEKLGVLFQLDIQLHNEKVWGPDAHLTVVSGATVYHAPTGQRLGYGEGICSTREKKYAYRQQERACPACGKPAVIKSKAEYGGGWLCWKKRDGCGAKFADGDKAIEGQEVGQVDNPDLPDLWNTVVKMAEKRARVDAVLAVTGASALFTQDVEDQVAPPPEPPPAEDDPGEWKGWEWEADQKAQSEEVTPDKVEDPPGDLTQTEARALFDRAKDVGVDGQRLSMKLTELGVEHGQIRNIGTAVTALRMLTGEQAQQVDEWLQGHSS